MLADWVRLVCVQHSLNHNIEWLYKRGILEDVKEDEDENIEDEDENIEEEEEYMEDEDDEE